MPLAENITLSPAVPTDIPALAHIAAVAFRTDSHTQLKAQFDGETAHEDGSKEALEVWIKHPRLDVIVARERVGHGGDDESERAVGWICWGRKGYDAQAIPDAREHSAPPLPDPDAAPRMIAGLKALNNDTMSYYVDQLMPPGVRCRFIVAVSVLPSHQGQGIGSALIGWGTQRCDEEGVFCWVSSSMGGWPMFEKQGFREVGKLEVELDEFAENKKNPERGSWGRYVWRWTKREPRPQSATV